MSFELGPGQVVGVELNGISKTATMIAAGQGLAVSPACSPVASNTTGPLTLGLVMARQSADTFCADACQAHKSLRDCLSSALFPDFRLLHEKNRGHHPSLQA